LQDKDAMSSGDTPIASGQPIGWWQPGDPPPEPIEPALSPLLRQVARPIYVAQRSGVPVAGGSGSVFLGDRPPGLRDALPLTAYAPPLHPRALGDA
jgi:hypothetical protein